MAISERRLLLIGLDRKRRRHGPAGGACDWMSVDETRSDHRLDAHVWAAAIGRCVACTWTRHGSRCRRRKHGLNAGRYSPRRYGHGGTERRYLDLETEGTESNGKGFRMHNRQAALCFPSPIHQSAIFPTSIRARVVRLLHHRRLGPLPPHYEGKRGPAPVLVVRTQCRGRPHVSRRVHSQHRHRQPDLMRSDGRGGG